MTPSSRSGRPGSRRTSPPFSRPAPSLRTTLHSSRSSQTRRKKRSRSTPRTRSHLPSLARPRSSCSVTGKCAHRRRYWLHHTILVNLSPSPRYPRSDDVADWAEGTIAPEAILFGKFDIIYFGARPGFLNEINWRGTDQCRASAAFATPNSSSTLSWDSSSSTSLLKRLVSAANSSGKGTRVALSVGGWGGSTWFRYAHPSCVRTLIDLAFAVRRSARARIARRSSTRSSARSTPTALPV